MRLTSRIFLIVALLYTGSSIVSFAKPKPRVLIFSKTAKYRHASIEEGKIALLKMGQEYGFDADTTEDASWFNEDKLKQYAAVIFLSTTGDVLDTMQQADFERYIQAGGGYVGVHAASDTEYGWPWYGKLVGGYFTSHPKIQPATLHVIDKKDISTAHLPADWIRTDEWYNFKDLNSDMHVLIRLDESTYEGGKNGSNHPIAWYDSFDGGRAFYTGLGHTKESWTEQNFLQHLLGGIRYAIGKNKKLDYKNVSTTRVLDVK